MSVRDEVLVGPAALRGLLDSARPVVLLDVRWALGRTDGHEQYVAGHVPGAVYVDLDTELASPPSAAEGRHPLPALDDLEASARRWGVSEGVTVVVYDDAGGMSAARAWWLLRWAGVEDVRLLDGGLAAWTASGGALETGDRIPDPGAIVLRGGQMPVTDADGTAALAADRSAGVVLDARAGERFRGELEPVDPRAGHVPGAVSAPTAENLGPDGRFLDDAALRARFEGLGVDVGAWQPGDPRPNLPVVVYCGSGVTAAHQVAALASVGVTATLYPGSWSQWSNDPEREVATGA
ncbi:sulfurtransferase [Flavimobilis sp. GY10621]|uniref:Sulfurtransferase n=1 Tax=Flavimobilis rhizosphaerae TaxID=2775421 RepID=A0ABR9DP07_9MICO|nr:sulfurtransferase [Flavimobilis rhizosphaerae]MBD9698850.1 sulfurtransferase [Flavimobilis rhizosphaerae]